MASHKLTRSSVLPTVAARTAAALNVAGITACGYPARGMHDPWDAEDRGYGRSSTGQMWESDAKSLYLRLKYVSEISKGLPVARHVIDKSSRLRGMLGGLSPGCVCL